MIFKLINNIDFKKVAVLLGGILRDKNLDNTLNKFEANADLQPLAVDRKSLNRPKDEPQKERFKRSTVSASHLNDKRLMNAHLRERGLF